MPQSQLSWSDTLNNHLITQQMNYNPEDEENTAHNLISTLNIKQQSAFQQIWNSITLKEGRIFFVDGFGIKTRNVGATR